MVALKTGTLVGACCQEAGHLAGMEYFRSSCGSLPVMLAYEIWPQEVYHLLSRLEPEATARLQDLVWRDRVHDPTRDVLAKP